MIDNLKAMALFVRTVELGSFRAAAESFGISPSVVSQQVSALERSHGVALLYRSTRRLSLTDEGEAFFSGARRMTEAAETALGGLRVDPKVRFGRLTLSMPNGLLDGPYLGAISEFMSAHPKISLALHSADGHVDLIGERVDLALRAGVMPDSTLKTRALGGIERILVASPKLLDGRRDPKHPSELSDWPWIRLSVLPPRRTFRKAGNQHSNPDDVVTIDYRGRVEVDSVHAMHRLTCEGIGLSTPPIDMVRDDLDRGRLVNLLPAWRIETMPVHAVWPPNVAKNSLTALLLEFLADRFT